MNELAEEAKKMPGLIEMSSWVDENSDQIFAMSLWASKDEGMTCWQKLGPLAAKYPLADWERAPRSVFMNLISGS